MTKGAAYTANWKRNNPEKWQAWLVRTKVHREAASKAFIAGRRAMVNDLKASPRLDCGNRYPPVCMQFDHVRGVKVADVSKCLHSLAKLTAEIAKCDLVCANCHAIRTISRGQQKGGGTR